MLSGIIGGLVASAVPSAFFYWLGRRQVRHDMAAAIRLARGQGYEQGRSDGFRLGSDNGFERGKLDGLREGDNAGYIRGFDRGRDAAHLAGQRKECRIKTAAHATGQRAGVLDGIRSSIATLQRALTDREGTPQPAKVQPEDMPF